MKRSSCLFRWLNGLGCCDNGFNRLALRVSRGLDEASGAIPSRRCRRERNCCRNNGCRHNNCRNSCRGHHR